MDGFNFNFDSLDQEAFDQTIAYLNAPDTSASLPGFGDEFEDWMSWEGEAGAMQMEGEEGGTADLGEWG